MLAVSSFLESSGRNESNIMSSVCILHFHYFLTLQKYDNEHLKRPSATSINNYFYFAIIIPSQLARAKQEF